MLDLKWKNRREIIDFLKSGKIGVMPTETVAGLFGVEDAGINDAKGSPSDKPLTRMCADLDQIAGVLGSLPTGFSALCGFWPGPLTLIDETAGTGFRIPDIPKLVEILKETGPLGSTSANISKEPAPATPADCSRALLDRVGFRVLETCPSSGEASSVVLISETCAKFLRVGSLGYEQLNGPLKKVGIQLEKTP